MPAKPSGQIKTSVIKKPQKNGDTYILERRTIYDPEKKYTKVLSTKLIAKIPKGSEIPVPTRPKRGKNSIPDTKTQIVTAKRNHIGMMDIIGHIAPHRVLITRYTLPLIWPPHRRLYPWPGTSLPLTGSPSRAS